jgi:hypothetical protein
MLGHLSKPLPGLYPLIKRIDPDQGGGIDNLGTGYTQHSEAFRLKVGGYVGAAEFVGAKLADVCGIPACQPAIVTIQHPVRGDQNVFGSRIESGLHNFDQNNLAAWRNVLAKCVNLEVFSATLAVDLVLGNDDRHWANWLVQQVKDSNGEPGFRMRAMDFSRSWPTLHPPQHPLRHRYPQTSAALKYWDALGIPFEQQVFHATCAKIGLLNEHWLRNQVLREIEGVFITTQQADQLGDWWRLGLRAQVIEAIHSLESGVWS